MPEFDRYFCEKFRLISTNLSEEFCRDSAWKLVDYGAAGGGGSKIIRRGTYAPWEHIYFQAPIRLSEAHLVPMSGPESAVGGVPRSNVRPR